MPNFEGAPETESLPDPKKIESARKALGSRGESEIAEEILTHPELVDTLDWVHEDGRTVSTGFYGDIKKTDPALARAYLKEVVKEEPSLLPEMRLDRVIPGGEVDAETAVLVHKLNVSKATDFEAKPFERSKTEMELAMIGRAAENVNALRGRYGLAPVELTPEQVHVVKKEFEPGKEEGKDRTGHNNGESVVVYEKNKDTARFATIQHELIHLGGHAAISVPKGTDEPRTYRGGLQVESQRANEEGEYASFLLPLNEAVTEENARRFTMAITEDDPELGELAKKRKQSLEDMETIRARGNKMRDKSFLEEELYCADVDWERKQLNTQTASYQEERQAMWQLFDKIHEKNPDAFPNKSQTEAREAMFDMVTKASLDGNILPFGRLMNDTFGRGTFREYGHLQTPQEIVSLIDSLEKVKDK